MSNDKDVTGATSHLTQELDLTGNDLDNLRHMVGAVSNVAKRNWGYRNSFAAGEDDVPSMERLLDAGFVVRGRKFNIGETDYYYHATLEGCKAIGLSKAATRRALEDW